MIFKFEGEKHKTCNVEVYSNENGIVVKFFDAALEPKEDNIVDYVFVDAGYGYISLKRKGEDAIMSGLLKKSFFYNSAIIEAAIEFVNQLLPDLYDVYIPYNVERITVYDAQTYTGETFDKVKNEN